MLFYIVPKGFFPEEDTGRLIGSLQADQSVSFQLMTQKLRQMMAIVQADPAVEHVVGYTGVGTGGGFGQINTGSVFVSLKSIEQRPPMDAGHRAAAAEAGQGAGRPALSLRRSGHPRRRPAKQRGNINTRCRPTIPTCSPNGRPCWSRRSNISKSWPTSIPISNSAAWNPISSSTAPTASRLGITPAQIDNTLYDAFGQRQVSVIYSAINQYHVVMEIDPRYTQYPAFAARYLCGDLRRRRFRHRNIERARQAAVTARPMPATPHAASAQRDGRGQRQ